MIITLLLALFASCSNQSRLYVGDGRLYIDGTPVGEIAPYTTANIRTTDKVERVNDNTIKLTRTFEALADIDSVPSSVGTSILRKSLPISLLSKSIASRFITP